MQERTELLGVIREMINVEIERRGVGAGECPHSCKPPPEARPRRRTFLQWLKRLFKKNDT